MKAFLFPPGVRFLAVAVALFLLPFATASIRAEEPAEAVVQTLPDERVADGVFTVGVIGDSLGDGIWAGLYRMLQRDPRFEIVNFSKQSSGLARPEYFDWPATAETLPDDFPLDAIVVVVGLNDNQAMDLPDDTRIGYRREGWAEEYRRRIALVLQPLQAAELPVTWVGLPIMRTTARAEQAALLNELFVAETEVHGVPFVDTWALTTDENGEYTTHLPDENGRKRLVRANDGMHFTGKGYEILARAVVDSMAARLSIFVAEGTQ